VDGQVAGVIGKGCRGTKRVFVWSISKKRGWGDLIAVEWGEGGGGEKSR